MDDAYRPRHIRDIAHIYLSRSRKTTGSPSSAIAILVGADSQDCFPAVHVANLAAAFSARNATVRLYELSGVLPNAGFYFAQPPRSYLRARRRGFQPGLNGVSINYDIDGLADGSSRRGGPLVCLFHLPTLGGVAEVKQSLVPLISERWIGHTWVLGLAKTMEGASNTADALRADFRTDIGFHLTLDGRLEPPESTATTINLGYLDHWVETLTDRVPIVVRDPRSELAQAYTSICESMLCRLKTVRRRDESTHFGRIRSRG